MRYTAGFAYPLHQPGGSLAGKDSMPASSTASRADVDEAAGHGRAGHAASGISSISDGSAVSSAGRSLRGMEQRSRDEVISAMQPQPHD
jgi:hypothetical protein